MKTILFVNSDMSSANGICLINIIDSVLLNNNYRVILLSNYLPEKFKNNSSLTFYKQNLRFVDRNSSNFFKVILKKLLLLTHIRRYPLSSFHYSTIVKRIENISSQNKIDILFAVHSPIDELYAACLFKKKHPDVKLIAYYLDPVINKTFSNRVNFLLNKQIKMQNFINGFVDRNIYMLTHQRNFLLKEKSCFLDVPLFNHYDFVSDSYDFNKNEIKLVFAGFLDGKIRNPKRAFSILEFYNNSFSGKLILDVYSKKIVKNNNFVSYKGFIPKKIIDSLNYDCYLSIGNSIDTMIPSKIFEFISKGKPFIHISNSSNDPCEKYIKETNFGLFIPADSSYEVSADLINSFFNKLQNCPLWYNEKAFLLNKAEKVTEEITKLL